MIDDYLSSSSLLAQNGEAIGRSISKGRKERLRRFHQMRKRAFQGTEYDRGDESIIVFNNDGDPW